MSDPAVKSRTPVAYAPLVPQDRRRRGIAYWIRRFYCPDPVCADRRPGKKPRVLGRQTIRATYDPEAGYALTGYVVERVEFAHGLINLGTSPDGALVIGLPSRARGEAAGRVPMRRAQPVLSGDPALVGRHSPRRLRLPTRDFYSLEPAAVDHPCIVTCPSCWPHRYLLDGSFDIEELKRSSGTTL